MSAGHGWQPSAFAAAAAAFMALDDTDTEHAQGLIHIHQHGSLEAGFWSLQGRVTDWRLEGGDTLNARLQVSLDADGQVSAAVAFPRPPGAHRMLWAQAKACELQRLARQVREGGKPLLRWVAAFLDVVPTEDVQCAVQFHRAADSEDIEVITETLALRICRRTPAAGWVLRLNKRYGCEPQVALHVGDAGCEARVMHDLLQSAWVPGLRAPAGLAAA